MRYDTSVENVNASVIPIAVGLGDVDCVGSIVCDGVGVGVPLVLLLVLAYRLALMFV
jgi:hypothetical protein